MKIIPNHLILWAGAAAMIGAIALVTHSETTSATHPTTSDAEKAILARLTEIQTAAQAFDADKVFSSVLENNAGVIAQNGRLFLTRSDALEFTRQGFESLQSAGARIEYRFNQQRISFLSPTIALAAGEGSTSVTSADGRTNSVMFAQSVILVLTNGDWKVFHAHRSFVAPSR